MKMTLFQTLMTFIHMGYALMVFTFLLMIWFSSIKAENFLQDKQPCTFNPLCSCTKSYDSLGVVHCVDIYFPRIPLAINRSRLSTLHLRNNDLDEIEPYFLVNTGNGFYRNKKGRHVYKRCLYLLFRLVQNHRAGQSVVGFTRGIFVWIRTFVMGTRINKYSPQCSPKSRYSNLTKTKDPQFIR